MRIAQRRVEGFAQEFGEAHRNLARHAAFPLVLTPDLLYQIWANFVPEAPWTAVAHVLLSRLCRQVGYEMYEMDIADRNLLLRELKGEFGQERFDELGEFLLDYVAQRLTDDDADTRDLREAQEWTALAYTKPDEAARELAQRLSERAEQEDMGEVLRLASLVETLAEPLLKEGFEPLLLYADGITTSVRGDWMKAVKQFNRLPKTQFVGVDLCLPEMGTNYLELSNLLETGKWKEANHRTISILLQVADKERLGSLDQKSIEYFSCQDLRILDQLWITASQERFGFSVQNKIYQTIRGNIEYNEQVWDTFCEKVGWLGQDKTFLMSQDVTYNLSAPRGHLPLTGLVNKVVFTGGIIPVVLSNELTHLFIARAGDCLAAESQDKG